MKRLEEGREEVFLNEATPLEKKIEEVRRVQAAIDALTFARDFDPKLITSFNALVASGFVHLSGHFKTLSSQLVLGGLLEDFKSDHFLISTHGNDDKRSVSVYASNDEAEKHGYAAFYIGTPEKAMEEAYSGGGKPYQLYLMAQDRTEPTQKHFSLFAPIFNINNPKEHQGYAGVIQNIASIVLRELPSPITPVLAARIKPRG